MGKILRLKRKTPLWRCKRQPLLAIINGINCIEIDLNDA
jgi:hypothetical protein